MKDRKLKKATYRALEFLIKNRHVHDRTLLPFKLFERKLKSFIFLLFFILL